MYFNAKYGGVPVMFEIDPVIPEGADLVNVPNAPVAVMSHCGVADF
jgi:hypothetical protein